MRYFSSFARFILTVGDMVDFRGLLPLEDARQQQILSCLNQGGFEPYPNFGAIPAKFFQIYFYRIYDKMDYSQASFLVPIPNIVADIGFTSAGTIFISNNTKTGGFQRDEDIQRGLGAIIVSDRLKIMMEDAQLRHIAFRETKLSPSRPKLKSPFWELTSDLILPPLSPNCLLVDDKYQPYDGDPKTMCFLREGLSYPEVNMQEAELHYTAQAIAATEPFDLALSQERLGYMYERSLVASKKFYQFCAQYDLKMKWQPVRLDHIEA